MRSLLQSIITVFLVCIRILAWAQSPQTVNNGQQTQPVAFPPGCVFNWTNDKPSIGLPASGTGDIAPFTAINNGTTPVVATIKATPVPLGYAYISNQSSNDISVISVVTHMVVKTIPLPGQLNPFGVAATPDGSKVYITNVGSGTVSVISTASNTVIKTITVGDGPFGIAASPNGTTVYAINSNSGTISVINTATDAVDATINGLITPQGACVSPDGKWLYVTNASGNASLYIVNTATNAVDFTIPLNGTCNGGIAISPDGNTLYIANNAPGTITVFNTLTKTETKLIIGVSGPYGVTASPDGKRVYVANSFTKKVSVINTATNIIIKTINTSGVPFGVSVSTDGKELYVANHVSNKVDIISTATNSVITSVDVGSDPLSLGIFTTSIGCNGPPVTFSITVNPAAPTIIAGPVTGSISACVGTASASPDIQQFTVSGSDLTTGIKAAAPAGFEVSLSANSGYGSSVLLNQSGGKVTNVVVFVRSAASATGSISGNVVLTSAGAPDQNVAVSGVVNALLTVDPVTDKIYYNGDVTSPVVFTGTAGKFTWTNDKPGIGLPANSIGDLPSFTAVNTGTTPVIATIKVTPLPTDYAYVANQGSNMIAVINCTTHKVIKTINGGSIPVGIVTSADGKRVYIANNDASTVSVINTADNTLLTSISVGNSPYGIAISPDGSRVYTANSNAASISVIETQNNSVLTTIPNLPSIISIAISPDGKWVYAATEGSPNAVYIINASTNVLDSTIPLGSSYNYGMVITPDGKSLYFTNNQNSSVTRVNLVTKAVSSIPVGGGPYGIAINSTGTRVYVACSQANEVDIINTATNAVIKSLPATGAPFTVSVSSDDKELYVTNRSANAVDVFNTANYSKITTITGPAFDNPMSLGNFISKGPGCPGQPITFTITVKTATAQLTATAATGTISACEGSPSAGPNIQQFTLSGTALTAGVTVQAPAKFEVSLNPAAGYGISISLTPVAGKLSNTIIYVRSAQTATGSISGNVVISSAGVTDQSVAVNGEVNRLLTVNPVVDRTYNNGDVTTLIPFNGTASTFNWTNDTPGIGLAASGTGDITPFIALNNGSTLLMATITATPVPTSYAYIACAGLNSVAVINCTTHKVIKSIDVASKLYGVAASLDGRKVYFINNNTAGVVSVINTADNTLLTTITVGKDPLNVVLSPDGSRVYVTNSGDASISVINARTNTVVTTILNLPEVVSVCVSPDGKWLYAATSANSNKVYIINASTNVVDSVIPLSTSYNYGMIITPDGNALYITHAASNTVTRVNLVTKSISSIAVASEPHGIAVNSTGTRAYVACGAGQVDIINTATNTVIKKINIAATTGTLSLTNDDKELYVTSQTPDAVYVYNTEDYSLITTITGPELNKPYSFGNFISKEASCIGQPITFAIKVKATTPKITATAATGTISACEGSPSASPNIQQFTVSGTGLTAGVTATAPAGFEVSLLPNSGYGNSVILNQAGGLVTNIVVYVRSAASATGNIADNVVVTSTGAADQSVAVAGTINALPTVDKPGDATYTNGGVTTTVNFTGTGTSFTWTNDKPGIGLPANGFGDIPLFTAVNTGTTAITATIKVTPANATGCPGIPQTFTIKVNASPAITATVVSGSISACVGTASVSPNIQQFTVSGTGLTAGITVTAPAGFEVSLSANNGFSGAVTLNQSAGKVTNVLVYVRSAASAVVGPISGKITLATAGATNLTVEVSGTVSALPVMDPVGDKIYVNGDITTAVNFTGTGNIFHWVNDTPAIGLPASGTGDLPSFTAVNVSGSQLKATITVTPETKKYGYVTNANDNTVSVIDISTNKAVATIPVGSNPVRITISPDGSRVYVTNESSDDVSVINTSTNSVINTIPVGGVPSATVISSDGSKLYVANIYDNNISVIGTGSSSVVKTIPAGLTPLGVVLSNDGKLLYVSNNGENDLWVIDTATGALIDNIPVGKQAEGIAMSRDGNWVYVSNFQDGTISVINTATNKVTATLPIGSNPSAITVTPDGKLLYSTSDLDDKILVIDIASKQIVKTITVGTKPWGMLLNRDGSLLYVTTPADNTVLVINTATNQVVNKILVGAAPSAFGTLAVPGADCPGIPATFTITVNVQTPSITHSAVTGTIIACAGSPSASPNVQQFAVSGTALTGDITAMAPIGFEVSLSAISGFTKSVTLARTNGSVSNVVVYVRSADYAIGSVSGDVDLSTPGIPTQTVPVRGLVNALPTVNAIGNQTKQDGDATDAISFAGSGNQFRWTNDKPGIGLPAAGLGDIASFKAINTGATDITATVTVTPLKLGYAYIPDLQSNDVSVVSLASNSVIAFLPVGNHPIGVTINARNNLIYVTNADGSTVSIIDPATNTVKGSIPVGSSPYGIKSNADGSLLFVASLNGNSVAVIDVLTNAVIHTIDGFTGPIDVAVSPDGGTLYVSNNRSTTVSVIRIADYTLQKTINVGEGPYGLCFSPDGSKLYVANQTSRDISVINTATNTVSGTITGNFSPLYLGISPDGSRLYIPNVASTNVSVVNTATNAVVATIEGFGQPTGVNVSPDGKFVYVTSQSENKLSVIDAATNTVFNEIPVGKDPAAIGTFLSPSPACDGQPVTFTITVKASLPPVITNDQPPNGVNTIYGTPSPVTSFTISGRDMREGIKVTPPAGVEVSTDNINFSNTITVGAAGTIAPTTIYVRLAKNAPVGSYGGSISLESTGVNTIYPQLPVSLVSPAPLTVIANAKSKNYGILLAGAPGSADFTVVGLQNSETVQTVTITYGQGAAATDPAGTYAGSVTPADVIGVTFDPKNYAITYMNADLTVNKMPLTITADDKIKTYKDPNPILTLTYSGFVNNESPAQLTSLPVVSTIADETSLPGKYTILVSGAASPNYDIALVNGVLTVLGINVPLKIPNTFTPNDDGINDTWNIANIDSYPGCIVNIYNRWGQNVFSSVGYGKSWDGRYKGTLLPVSTYYYIIDLKNDSKPYSGSITIIR